MTQSEYQGLGSEPTTPPKQIQKPRGRLLPPVVMLIIFTTVNLLSYFDRGALSAMLEDISGNLKINSASEGLFASVFMFGYMIGSPILAHLCHTVEPFLVLSFGLFLWCAATLLCGFSQSYYPLLFGRLLTGFGEAGFLCIAPPLLDRLAPSTAKALWLSIFYAAIPVGYALGFAVSGVVLDLAWFDSNTWRAIFIGEAICMGPFVLMGLFLKSPFSFGAQHQHTDEEHKQQEDVPQTGYLAPQFDSNLDLSDDLNNSHHLDSETQSINSFSYSQNSQYSQQLSDSDSSAQLVEEKDSKFARLLKKNPLTKRLYALFGNKVYTALVFGYAAQTFVTGGFAFYGINYAKAVFHVSKTKAGVVFGGVTIISGIFGTLVGGIWLDRWRRASRIPSSIEDSTTVQQLIEANPACQFMTPEELEDHKVEIIAKRQDLRNPNMVKDRLQSIELALRLVILATAIAVPFALGCFLVNNLALFALLIFLAELALFLCLSVLNSAIIWSVPFNLSPQAIAFSVVVVHLLGDALSPLIMGFLLDLTNKSYRSVMISCCFPLALAIFFWSIGSGIVVKYLSTIRFYRYTDHPTHITNSNSRESYGILTQEAYEDLQPFVYLRKKLLWPTAESCH